MKLNGWHRLWILVSAVYFILVTSYVIVEFPKAENILHQPEFYKNLSKKSAGIIWPTTHDDALALGSDWIPEKVRKESYNVNPYFLHRIVEMPNKHIMEFSDNIKEEDIETVSKEYLRIIEQKATEKRLYFVFYAFLFWIIPCLALYALGWSINWVSVGFKKNKKAQH